MKKRLALVLALMPFAPAIADVPAMVATPGSPVDPARLAIASRIAERLFPDGTYEKLLGGSMNQLMAGAIDSSMDMPIRSLAGIGGMDAAKVKALGPATLRQVAEILDPAYQERMRIVLPVMMSEMGRFFTQFEPSLREGMAEAYASRFSEAQLHEIDIFYATPTGSMLAAQSTTIMMDPAVMSRMQAMMPKMMQAMPDIVKHAAEAASKLPKARKFEELSPTEKQRIAQLLGLDATKVK